MLLYCYALRPPEGREGVAQHTSLGPGGGEGRRGPALNQPPAASGSNKGTSHKQGGLLRWHTLTSLVTGHRAWYRGENRSQGTLKTRQRHFRHATQLLSPRFQNNNNNFPRSLPVLPTLTLACGGVFFGPIIAKVHSIWSKMSIKHKKRPH